MYLKCFSYSLYFYYAVNNNKYLNTLLFNGNITFPILNNILGIEARAFIFGSNNLEIGKMRNVFLFNFVSKPKLSSCFPFTSLLYY